MKPEERRTYNRAWYAQNRDRMRAKERTPKRLLMHAKRSRQWFEKRVYIGKGEWMLMADLTPELQEVARLLKETRELTERRGRPRKYDDDFNEIGKTP